MLLTGSIWWISVVELGHYSIGRQLKRHFVFWPNALNFPNKCAANTQRVFLLLVFNVLAPPSDFVLAPPGLRRMLLVGAAIGQTHPSHWLDFWGETSNHPPPPPFPTWPFDKNDSRFWQPVTLLTVSHVSHFGSASLFCLIWSLVQFTALPFVPKVKSQTWTRIVIEIHNCSCISFQTITICITN